MQKSKDMQLNYEILIDQKENKRKCTLYPLLNRENFSFSKFSSGLASIEPLISDILLHVDGEELDKIVQRNKTVRSIALIDCNWRKVEGTLKRLSKPWPTLAKIPPCFQTAYPRKSKKPGVDPEGGLASIEALFVASAFLSTWDMNLLTEFHFKDKFLQINEENWKKYQLGKYNRHSNVMEK